MTEHDELGSFQEAYMDYLEGARDTPPTLDNLADNQRRAAEAFIETIRATRGIDAFASRPPIEQLLEPSTKAAAATSNFGKGLQHHLRETVDPAAVVTVDAASSASGLDSTLVIQARGIQMRVVEEGSDNLNRALAGRAVNIARVFRTFADCQAVLYTTSGQDPRGVVLVRGDVHGAIETPSGEKRPPRVPRSVVAAATACEVWLRGLIPEFSPVSIDLRERSTVAQSALDAVQLASKVVAEVSASGKRARIEAKQQAWGGFGDRETGKLAAILEEARNGRLSTESYSSRVDELSEIAA